MAFIFLVCVPILRKSSSSVGSKNLIASVHFWSNNLIIIEAALIWLKTPTIVHSIHRHIFIRPFCKVCEPSLKRTFRWFETFRDARFLLFVVVLTFVIICFVVVARNNREHRVFCFTRRFTNLGIHRGTRCSRIVEFRRTTIHSCGHLCFVTRGTKKGFFKKYFLRHLARHPSKGGKAWKNERKLGGMVQLAMRKLAI